jgi:hypothetical protein
MSGLRAARDVLERAVLDRDSGSEFADEYKVAHPTRFERVTFAFGGLGSSRVVRSPLEM